MKIRAVIFDLDDTLVSEYEFIVSGYRYMSRRLAERLGRPPEEINGKLWELTREKYEYMFNRLFDSYGVKYGDEEMQEMIADYRNHPAGLRFYPDAYLTLKGLKDRGILMGIISDGDPERQRNKIRSAVSGIMDYADDKRSLHNKTLKSDDIRDSSAISCKSVDEIGLHNITNASGDAAKLNEAINYWFDEIILNDEFGGAAYRKPNPHGFKVMAERLHVEPSEMVYVGDNPAKDFHIAGDMPVRTARIIREKGIYNEREYLDGIKETWRLDSLTDLLNIIDGDKA